MDLDAIAGSFIELSEHELRAVNGGIGSGSGEVHARDSFPLDAPISGGASAFLEYDYAISCFAGETELLLGSGATVRFDALGLRPGGSLHLDVARADGTQATVRYFSVGPEIPPVVFLTTEDGTGLGVTERHPMLVASRGAASIMPAADLRIGHELFLYRGAGRDWRRVAIVGLERRSYPRDVFNLAVEGDGSVASHLVVANGVVTGDHFLQEMLRLGHLTWRSCPRPARARLSA